jgi:hypothetical protein
MYILLGVAVLAVLAGIIALLAWGSSGSRAEPTVSVAAIYTAAYQTFTAQQATQQAAIPPTTTPLPSPFPTLPAAAPLPINTLAFASPTTGVVAGCDNSAFVNDITIPDGTVMSPGQKFTKTWLMQNTGTCTWDTNYSLAFVSGDAMSGVKTPLTLSVPPGQQIKISVDLIAPTQTGDFKGIWQLMNGNGVSFGATPWVLIKVAAATPTATTAPTNTSAPPTNTSAPTNTSTPTDTPTPATPPGP